MDELNKWARDFGQKTAWSVFDQDDCMDFATLDRNSNRAAQLLLSHGLRPGDVIALMMRNCSQMIELMWAARRLGLYYTPISIRLTAHEAAYILADCGARVFFVDSDASDISFEGVRYRVGSVGSSISHISYEQYRDSFHGYATLQDVSLGKDFVYSSGTTGQPKGVRRRLLEDPAKERQLSDWIQVFSKHDENSICLVSAPLYHAAPLRFAMRSIQRGGSVVALPKFDPITALRAIEELEVTHSLWVATMFYRLLALPRDVRCKYDTGSLRLALHSGGPCAADLKRRMIDWWGSVVWEYYAASEGNGATCISPDDALTHPGSVGRAVLGQIHILDARGNEMQAGVDGDIYFEGGPSFTYHNDPNKTDESRNSLGWTTTGDIGHLDEDGFLYLSDRKAHTIISGGVNIYPAEIEHVLLAHPEVADAAVFGIPNEEFGEEVKAVVELKPDVPATADTAKKLQEHCRTLLSSIKIPRSISFEPSLPRQDSGKLPKMELKKRYSSVKSQ